MSLLDLDFEAPNNPVDAIESLAALNDWSFERLGDDEISISVSGAWCDYHVTFSWMEEVEALHMSTAFDQKVPAARKVEVLTLLSSINEQLWMGHFDLWSREGLVIFRQSLLLAGGAEANDQQIQIMLSNSLDACERYYQALQFVIWAGKSASEAMETVMFETAGEA
ncbi:YbjN domain-containing protein [Polycladidibacter hongkongensis]|uniref:YbjN domain-containing protein n=1 Tax=Polycladidibacter hongkongensis TaxID=1647556 RepID=UPI000829E5D5|nr:YbjN domain-containing protein [Pseudovibrio hongkongensis]